MTAKLYHPTWPYRKADEWPEVRQSYPLDSHWRLGFDGRCPAVLTQQRVDPFACGLIGPQQASGSSERATSFQAKPFVWPHKSKLSMAWELTGWAVAWFLVWIWIWLIVFGIF